MRLLAMLTAGRSAEAVAKTQRERDADAIWREVTRTQAEAHREAVERILAQARGPVR